jgi:hypothetical protein
MMKYSESSMHYVSRILILLLVIITAFCIDPYTPSLKNYKSNLVVEGLITNENNSYKIQLSRTISKEDLVPEKINDAGVYITDGDGRKITLQNFGNGYYKTDSTSFKGTIGQKYTLHILTSDGQEYVSDECTMLPVINLDSIYYEKSNKFLGTPAKDYTGLRIMLNIAKVEEMNQYLRWTFDEVWKFKIPFPQLYTYTLGSDFFLFQSVPNPNPTCWKSNNSSEIITNSIFSIGTNTRGQEIQFIAPELSDRLEVQYSINVKQYSISEQEFSFWNNLKQVGEPGGDIFGALPYSVPSNIHNVNNINEMVLGYFSVSAITQKRIFITPNELDPLFLPHYKTDCPEIRKSPDDWNPPISWDEIYFGYVTLKHYAFVGPEVIGTAVLPGRITKSQLIKFVFTTRVCSLCEVSGFTQKPDFWIDLK